MPMVVSGRWKGFYWRLSVYFSLFIRMLSQTDAAGIDKLDVQMFHDDSWKPDYFAVRRSRVTKTLHFCECWFLLVISS